MSSRLLLLGFSLVLAAAGCGPADHGETLVFAASSLAVVLPEIGAAHEAETGRRVRFSFGSSAALARQVAAGAPADLLVSAEPAVTGTSVEARPDRGASSVLASNELALVTARGASWPPDGVAGLDRLAVGDWRSEVPVGLAAREWLAARGEWEAVRDRLLPCADARATLAAVVSGSAPAGIVYATDAASTDRVRVVERPSADGPRVRYVVHELRRDRPDARAFALFLTGPAAAAAFERHGFRAAAGARSGR